MKLHGNKKIVILNFTSKYNVLDKADGKYKTLEELNAFLKECTYCKTIYVTFHGRKEVIKRIVCKANYILGQSYASRKYFST